MRFIIGLGMIILLSSCATTTNNYYTETVNSWRGGSANNLINRWGMPDEKITTPDGKTTYLYKTVSYRAYSGSAVPLTGVHLSPNGEPVIITSSPANQTGTRGVTLDCATTFIANKQGIITDTTIQGSACYGSETFASKMRNPR